MSASNDAPVRGVTDSNGAGPTSGRLDEPLPTRFLPRLSRYHFAIAVALILAVYALEAHARREFNPTPASQGDQGAYLAYARLMHDSDYAYVGLRNRMPVYPFLLSLIYDPGLTEAQFLARAQALNVNLSILLLLLLAFVFRNRFSPALALALLAATAFGVFLYRAPLAQTELLYYCISFGGFLLLLQLLIAPRWWLAILGGVVVGLGHLTKASVLPGLAIWSVIFLAQIFWNKVPARSVWRRLLILLLVLGTFLAVVFPYIRTSKQLHGEYFYNVNSTFVMWCDSSEEGWRFLNSQMNNNTAALFTPDQIPSAGRYWREHSVAQIGGRLARGLGHLVTQKAMATGYYKFVILFVLTLAVLALRHWRRVVRSLAERPFAAAFCFLFCFGYLLLFAWYEAIISDTRFILSIFLPCVYSGAILIRALAGDGSVAVGARRFSTVQLFAAWLFSLTLIDVAYNGFRALRG